ncbi:hypothetical protein [Nostoc sp.]|uniref:hypothetical protein n=1 Tax=Nostoc sp. TaxID=1180 RepID=UPI002FF93104
MRQDSLLYARHKEPDDPGVVVYFKIKDKNYALCCVDTERLVVHWCQLKPKTISDRRFANPSRPHPLTPSPKGEGELNV